MIPFRRRLSRDRHTDPIILVLFFEKEAQRFCRKLMLFLTARAVHKLKTASGAYIVLAVNLKICPTATGKIEKNETICLLCQRSLPRTKKHPFAIQCSHCSGS